jgi:hypothetical protein
MNYKKYILLHSFLILTILICATNAAETTAETKSIAKNKKEKSIDLNVAPAQKSHPKNALRASQPKVNKAYSQKINQPTLPPLDKISFDKIGIKSAMNSPKINFPDSIAISKAHKISESDTILHNHTISKTIPFNKPKTTGTFKISGTLQSHLPSKSSIKADIPIEKIAIGNFMHQNKNKSAINSTTLTKNSVVNLAAPVDVTHRFFSSDTGIANNLSITSIDDDATNQTIDTYATNLQNIINATSNYNGAPTPIANCILAHAINNQSFTYQGLPYMAYTVPQYLKINPQANLSPGVSFQYPYNAGGDDCSNPSQSYSAITAQNEQCTAVSQSSQKINSNTYYLPFYLYGTSMPIGFTGVVLKEINGPKSLPVTTPSPQATQSLSLPYAGQSIAPAATDIADIFSVPFFPKSVFLALQPGTIQNMIQSGASASDIDTAFYKIYNQIFQYINSIQWQQYMKACTSSDNLIESQCLASARTGLNLIWNTLNAYADYQLSANYPNLANDSAINHLTQFSASGLTQLLGNLQNQNDIITQQLQSISAQDPERKCTTLSQTDWNAPHSNLNDPCFAASNYKSLPQYIPSYCQSLYPQACSYFQSLNQNMFDMGSVQSALETINVFCGTMNDFYSILKNYGDSQSIAQATPILNTVCH